SSSAPGGGIAVPVEMGSRATDLTAGFGGLCGRALQAGDHLEWDTGAGPNRASSLPLRQVPASRHPFRVVRGPQADRFDDHAWRTFLTRQWRVSSRSNRVGIRLEGPLIIPRDRSDMISEGMVTGTIQITAEGQPIVMLPARPTIGGYPKIATVIAADLDRLGQLCPGETIHFTEAGADT
ncbi:MAG TPA: biotin-dependent carboxyltransferase family protein, partial [Thermomicrobiales bacterium]|nr:biotin-dependent carboxyltransferase family protein [Thermomicrobiales bacterium]